MEETQTVSKKKRRKAGKTNWLATAGISLILIAAALLVCFFLNGKTTVTGGWPEPETSESLSCEAEGRAYPFFRYDNSTKKTTKITAVFKNDVLKTISLVHELYYNSSAEITQSEAENHAALNLRMQDERLGADALGANYAKLEDRMKMSLFADADKLNSGTVKYFELDWTESGEYNLATARKNYEAKGYKCATSEE